MASHATSFIQLSRFLMFGFSAVWGCSYVFSCRHMVFSGVQHQQVLFMLSFFKFCFAFLMLSLNLGARPDGSRVLLTRPHGAPTRVGSQTFRVIFLTFGGHRTPRTCIFSFLSASDWHTFLSTRLTVSFSDLFFFISSHNTTCGASASCQPDGS